MTTTSETKKRGAQDGVIEGRIREWIIANVAAAQTFTRRDVCGIAKRVDGALGLGMTGGLARAAIRSFVARVLAQRGQLPA